MPLKHTIRSYTPSLLRLLLTVGLLLPALGSSPVGAETLVLLDGQTIETKGPWKLEGRRITYTALNGTFSAIRSKLVDLDETKALQERTAKAAEEPAPAAKPAEAGLVVKQGDLRQAVVGSPTPEAVEASPAVDAGEIGVASWTEDLIAAGTRLTGTLTNRTADTYLSLTMDVTLIADNGDELATRKASLLQNWVDIDNSITFEVSFPDVFAYGDVAFAINGQPFKRPSPEAEGDLDGEATAGAETPPNEEDPPAEV